ncbi:TIGR02996 domain-containing protein [Fimbriiglobus ruber]|uniref:Uncharacterized protein n=1 Tax=Fimbriiglobus ruber TaxID=1908690 RepID=A0A225DU96_9BACT|nr:TIGR02996 domain-containing protein [Fimbriiglobus ruber]OWK45100.1 hypothetical protein FRUB_01431 [Fimbriiglobus ruber]
MRDDSPFLAAIAAEPEDDLPRLVFADWLDEHDDPDRAEFIRVQCTLARNADGRGNLPAAELVRLEARERLLLSRNRDLWLQPLRNLNAHTSLYGEFSRGFVNDLIVDTATFLARGDELWRHSPVIELRLTHIGEQARKLADCPYLARVGRLELGGQPLGTEALGTILASPHLAGLAGLSLDSFPLRDEDLATLAAGPALPPVRGLSIAGAEFTGATLPRLLSRFPDLKHFSLSDVNEFRGELFADTLAALNPDRLQTVNFWYTPLAAAGVRALADAKVFTGLTELWLRGCSFDAAAMEALAGAAHLSAVSKLYLGSDPLGEDGGVALAAWPGLRAVRTLNIDRCGIGTRGCEAIARSPHLGPLDRLELRANGIGDAAVEALAASRTLSGLHTLNLSENAVTITGARALATSAHMGRLRHLDVRENAVGDEGAEAFVASPHFRGLRWLTVAENGISRDVGRRLIVSFPDLTVFQADGAFLTGEHLAALRAELVAGGSEAEARAAVEDWLVQSILDAPNDLTVRRMYSTFLQDANSPWWVVILLQDPEDWRPDEVMQRWQQWFETGRDEWLAPLARWAEPIEDESFDRGFLRTVRFTGPVPDEVAEDLSRFPPLALLPLEVQRGNMTGEGAFQILARHKNLARMTRLEFRAVTGVELVHVLGSPHLTALEELAIGPCGLRDEAARLLASAPALVRLRELNFGWNPGSRSEMTANQVGPSGLAALGSSPCAAGLKSLGLRGNRTIGDAGLRALLAAPHLNGLETLDLRSTGLSDKAVRTLAGSPWVKKLRTLRLGGLDALGDDAVAALAATPYLTGLRELEITGDGENTCVPATDTAARALAGSNALSGLSVLRLTHWAGLTDVGRAALGDRFGQVISEDV